MAATFVDKARSERRPAPASGSRTSHAPGQRRNRAAVALGVLLILGFGVGGAVLVTNAGHRDAVLAIAREVQAGTRITDGDLRVAKVRPDSSLSPVPASLRSQVVGRVARVGLVPGTLLTPAELAPKGDTGVPAGQSVVALLLHYGEAPTLAAGDRVLVVAPAQNLSVAAQVLAVQSRGQNSDDVRLSLMADDANASRIASIAAAKGDISVVLRPSGP